jgi:hypothetical protein
MGPEVPEGQTHLLAAAAHANILTACLDDLAPNYHICQKLLCFAICFAIFWASLGIDVVRRIDCFTYKLRAITISERARMFRPWVNGALEPEHPRNFYPCTGKGECRQDISENPVQAKFTSECSLGQVVGLAYSVKTDSEQTCPGRNKHL